MDSRKASRVSDFPRVYVNAIFARFRERCKERERRPRKQRVESWGDSLIRNRNKLRTVLEKRVRQAERSSPWQHWITASLDGLHQRVDIYHRWYRREYNIIEKLNNWDFNREVCYMQGFAWTFVASEQCKKLLQKRLPHVLIPRKRRSHWGGCAIRIWNEYARLMESPVAENGPWDFVANGAVRKFHVRLDVETDWAARMVESARRLSRDS